MTETHTSDDADADDISDLFSFCLHELCHVYVCQNANEAIQIALFHCLVCCVADADINNI